MSTKLQIGLVVGLTVASGAVTGAGQQPLFRTATTLVPLQVTVTQGNKVVSGLGRNDFAVLEDGVPQELAFFESNDVPLDVVLLLDISASMATKLDGVHEAAKAFMNTLRPGDRGAVVGFNQNLKVMQSLTNDHRAIERAIKQTRPGGTTSLRNTLYVALKQLALPPPTTTDEIRRQTFVLLTDGEDNSSMIPYDDVLSVARNSGVNLYTIVVRPLEKKSPVEQISPESDFEMRRLAEETGGTAHFSDSVEQLKRAYTAIAAELSANYSLAYSSPNAGASRQQFHRIEVQVRANGEYQVRARRGYTAEAAGLNH